MNISSIDILKNLMRFEKKRILIGIMFHIAVPKYFSDIKFYVNQTKVVSCVDVMCMYSAGFSAKITEDHGGLRVVKFVNKNSH